MNDARQAFGPTLRTHRERQGIPLSTIAERTKIGIGLLAALERNDVSKWPKGIFRRAFFREYVLAIGLSPEPLLSEFARLFPDGTDTTAADATDDLRMALAHSPSTTAIRRIAIALGELAAILFVGFAGARVLDLSVLSVGGAVALIYYPVSNACRERPAFAPRAPADKRPWPGPGTPWTELRTNPNPELRAPRALVEGWELGIEG